MSERRGWFRFWIIASFAFALIELWQVFRGTSGVPLTTVARARLLGSAGGSFLIGAVLVWLARHWLFDAGGLDFWDAFFATLGGILGLWGHGMRRSVA